MTAAETQRAWWAIQLAHDINTCESLLRGELVDESALDAAALAQARKRRLVTLRPVAELFGVEEASS